MRTLLLFIQCLGQLLALDRIRGLLPNRPHLLLNVLEELAVDFDREVLDRERLADRLAQLLPLRDDLLPSEGHLAVKLAHSFCHHPHSCCLFVARLCIDRPNDLTHLHVLVLQVLDASALVSILVNELLHRSILCDIHKVLLQLLGKLIN